MKHQPTWKHLTVLWWILEASKVGAACGETSHRRQQQTAHTKPIPYESQKRLVCPQQCYIAWRLNPPFTKSATAMFGTVSNTFVEWLLVCVLPFTKMQAKFCALHRLLHQSPEAEKVAITRCREALPASAGLREYNFYKFIIGWVWSRHFSWVGNVRFIVHWM